MLNLKTLLQAGITPTFLLLGGLLCAVILFLVLIYFLFLSVMKSLKEKRMNSK